MNLEPLQSFLQTPSRAKQELLILGIALLVGVVVLPPLIYFVGTRIFGAYAGGGLGDLLGNFFRGLASGSFGFWTVAVTPYLVVVTLRFTVWLTRYLRTL